jgi:hypothetical protein
MWTRSQGLAHAFRHSSSRSLSGLLVLFFFIMASIHPIHHPDAAYGPPEVHIPYPAEPVHYPPYINNADDDADRESLTGEAKGDETTAEEWAQPVRLFDQMVRCVFSFLALIRRYRTQCSVTLCWRKLASGRVSSGPIMRRRRSGNEPVSCCLYREAQQKRKVWS